MTVSHESCNQTKGPAPVMVRTSPGVYKCPTCGHVVRVTR